MKNTENTQLLKWLSILDRDQKLTITITGEMLRAAAGAIFPMDMFAIAASKRCLATNKAFIQLVNDQNLVCSRALLRTHIDTAVRFSAAWFVDDGQKFASDVIAGERIDKIKDANGKRLTDAHLIECRSHELRWLPVVYQTLSGYVHLSASHFHSAVRDLNDETRQFNLAITPDDSDMPEPAWVEMVECFHDCTVYFHKFLRSWCVKKSSIKVAS